MKNEDVTAYDIYQQMTTEQKEELVEKIADALIGRLQD